MSTGQSTQAPLIQGNQNNIEHDASQSALLYLFQEVSKLAPPIHNSLLDTRSGSNWLNDTSFKAEQKEDASLFHTSNISCQRSLSYVSQCHHKKIGKEESHSNKVTALTDAHPKHNSPWKVLSLINLQCDRILHHTAVESDQTTETSTLDPLIDNTVTTLADVTAQGTGGDCFQSSLRPCSPLCDGRGTPHFISQVEDVPEFCSGEASTNKPQCIVKDSEVSCDQSQSTEATTVGLKLVVENEAASSDSQHKDSKDELSVRRQPEQKHDCDICFSPEQILDLSFPGNALTHNYTPKNSPNNIHLPLHSNGDLSAAPSKPELTLDHNANYVSTREPLSDSQPEDCLSKQDDNITDCSPLEEKSIPVSPLSSLIDNGDSNLSLSATSKPEPRSGKQECPSSVQQWRTKTPRKQPYPSRSADIQDPDFQGVTFRMDTELDNNTNQCRLLITSKFSKELCKGARKPKLRSRTSQTSLKTSSSEEESDPTTCVSKGKVCASCCTRKTPMWRDAEDGTPLCNACGIRYKKYRVRCVNCWHIPRKEGNTNSRCIKCGNFVRLTPAQRKHST